MFIEKTAKTEALLEGSRERFDRRGSEGGAFRAGVVLTRHRADLASAARAKDGTAAPSHHQV